VIGWLKIDYISEKSRYRLLAANGAFLFGKKGGNMRKVVEKM
jgi:hypothetical protein